MVDGGGIIAGAARFAVVDVGIYSEADLVDDVVGIGAQGDGVLARFQDVTAAFDLDLVGVVGGHILLGQNE